MNSYRTVVDYVYASICFPSQGLKQLNLIFLNIYNCAWKPDPVTFYAMQTTATTNNIMLTISSFVLCKSKNAPSTGFEPATLRLKV